MWANSLIPTPYLAHTYKTNYPCDIGTDNVDIGSHFDKIYLEDNGLWTQDDNKVTRE